MATFTTWAELRDALKDALMNLVSSNPYTKEYTINGRTHVIRDVQDIKDLLSLTYEMEDIENRIGGGSTVTYSKFSRR